MLAWYSPVVPSYIDVDALAYCIYENFYKDAPCKTGKMRDGIDYQVLGSRIYFWDEVIYSNFQDKETAYAGWWSQSLPHMFNYWLEIFEENAREANNDG